MTRIRQAFPLTSALALALGLALPAQAPAQSSTGTITGTYNADNAVWVVGEDLGEDVPDSGWRETDDGLEITLAGNPGAEEMGLDGPLLVTFTVGATPENRVAQDAQVVLRLDGYRQPFIADPETLDLAVNAVEIEGDSLAIAGDLVAAMAPGGTDEVLIEDDETRLFDGNFQATLMRLEDAPGSEDE